MAEGWSLIGVLDGGIDPEHPDLRTFTGSDSVGGAFVPGGSCIAYGSQNVAWPFNLQLPNEVRDWLPQPTDATTDACDGLDLLNDDRLSNLPGGHGTHVAGLIGANAQSGTGIRGTCVACGIQVARIGTWTCSQATTPAELRYSMPFLPGGMTALAKNGVQIANFSGGLPTCGQSSCVTALALLKERDILFVASAGNHLGFPQGVQWPAQMTDVVAAGGLNPAKQMWDLSPNDCPYDPLVPTPPLGATWCTTQSGVPFPSAPVQTAFNYVECGSHHPRQDPFTLSACPPIYQLELMALAEGVWSLFPNVPGGLNWNQHVDCGDAEGVGAFGTASDGIGPCTGTSMSAPIISGILGVLRSINPLMPAGNPFEPSSDPFTRAPALLGENPFNRNVYGVRDLLAKASGSGVVDMQLGLGIPNAAVAVAKMLGESAGEAVVNRVTPLFALYSPTRKDYAAVATPQMAMALAYDENEVYQMGRYHNDDFIEGVAVPNYAFLPNAHPHYIPQLAVKAAAMVLTTHITPDPAYPPVIPLFLMERPAPVNQKNSKHVHDTILVSSIAQVEAATALGYHYLGRQGYIYEWCESPGCAPPGTEALHLLCNTDKGVQDCAVFLDSQAATFGAASYNSWFPGAVRSQLGLAYTMADADGDGLVDAMEHLIGTSIQHADSDGDLVNDANEYPLATAPFSDPCEGFVTFCTRIDARLFRNGFEPVESQ